MPYSNKNCIPLVLAPMAGVTDLSFRKVCRRLGATHTVTEMVSAKALTFGDKKSFELLRTDGEDSPVAIQIFGNDAKIVANGARLAYEHVECPSIDINMGCPVHKIFGNGEGSALMKSPGLIYDIVREVKEAVPCPVTVKMRAGVDPEHENAVECALAAEEAGAAAITVHGRYRSQMYAPPVNYDIIGKVKSAVSVPVIGNGDVVDGKSARDMLSRTGCDGIMVGRAAMGNPFVFAEISAYLKGEEYSAPSLEVHLETARAQLSELIALEGERKGCREARSRLAWYLKGIRGAASLRAMAGSICTLEDINRIIDLALKGGGADG